MTQMAQFFPIFSNFRTWPQMNNMKVLGKLSKALPFEPPAQFLLSTT